MSKTIMRLVFALLVCLIACSSDDLNRKALDEALATAQSKDPATGKADIQSPYGDLGPHMALISLSFFVRTSAGFRHRVGIKRRIHLGGKGEYRILDDRTWTDPDLALKGTDDGRELLFDGQRFVSRRKWGPWKERPTWRGEHTQALDQAYDVIPTVLEMFDRHISRMPGSNEVMMMKETRWETLSLNTTPSEEKRTGNPVTDADRFDETRLNAWFATTHHPEMMAGRVARRVDNGAIMRAELALSGRAKVKREDARFELTVSFSLRPLDGATNFKLPENVLPAGRERVWTMVKDVLGSDLSTIYERVQLRPQP
jgi:hypothetical protein